MLRLEKPQRKKTKILFLRLTHQRLTPVSEKVRDAASVEICQIRGSRTRAHAQKRSTGKASGGLRVLEMRNVIHFLAKVGQLCTERAGEVQTGRLEDKPALLR